jgi:UDP-N-acetylglucosamine 2-epimerase
LRTNDPYSPFPEEINRRVAGVLSTYHFAPTERAAEALRAEQVPEARIHVTGNTVVDALLWTLQKPVDLDFEFSLDGKRTILVTAHWRESFGAPFRSLCYAIWDLAERNEDVAARNRGRGLEINLLDGTVVFRILTQQYYEYHSSWRRTYGYRLLPRVAGK